jgi:WD40 repeat protein
VRRLAVSPDGRLLAAGSHRTLRLWELPSGRAVGRAEFDREVESLSFSGDGALLCVGQGLPITAPQTALWDVARRAVTRRLVGPHTRPHLVGGSLLVGRLFAGHGGRDVFGAGCWDVGSGAERRLVWWPHRDLAWAELLPDGRLLAVAADRAVRVWPAGTLLGGRP